MDLKTAYIWLDELMEKLWDSELVDEEIEALKLCKLMIKEKTTGYSNNKVR